MTTITIEAINTLKSELVELQSIDRSAMNSSEKRKHTIAVNAKKAELESAKEDYARIDTGTDDDAVSDEEAELFAALQTSYVVDAIRSALNAEKAYTDTLLDVAAECDDVELFEAIKAAAYDVIREEGLTVSGSIRNAFSVVKWALENCELNDENGEARNINQIKKEKEAQKNKASGSSKSDSSEEGENLPETGNTDLDMALQNIALLNTKAGELRKAKDDTAMPAKAKFLRNATVSALETYATLLATLIEDETLTPIIEDADLDGLVIDECEVAEAIS